MAPLIGALFRPTDKGTALGSHPISFWATAAPLLNRHWSLPHPPPLISLLVLFFTFHTDHNVSSLLAFPVLFILPSIQYPGRIPAVMRKM